MRVGNDGDEGNVRVFDYGRFNPYFLLNPRTVCEGPSDFLPLVFGTLGPVVLVEPVEKCEVKLYLLGG